VRLFRLHVYRLVRHRTNANFPPNVRFGSNCEVLPKAHRLPIKHVTRARSLVGLYFVALAPKHFGAKDKQYAYKREFIAPTSFGGLSVSV
jgi:hypothetical protein